MLQLTESKPENLMVELAIGCLRSFIALCCRLLAAG